MSVVAQRVQDLLDANMICYETRAHVTDYTALETAEHTHTPGKAFAKAVIVLADQELVMAVVAAPEHVDLDVLQRHLGADHIKLAKEWRIRSHFPDCDRGAIPPFGNLYDMPVYLCPTIAKNDLITFNAGSHEMVISLSYRDYEELVRPKKVAKLGRIEQ